MSKVRLISISQAEDGTHPEQLITDIARVSNPKNQGKDGTALLKYLIKHKHWSPFEHCFITLEIKTSRALTAQLCRHRSFTFQEFSQRYSSVTTFEDIELRLQGKTNRQVGDEPYRNTEMEKRVAKALASIKNTYDSLIEEGVARECARMILPMAASSRLYMTGSLRSWLHFLQIRLEEGAQKEVRIISQEIYEILKEKFPTTFSVVELP